MRRRILRSWFARFMNLQPIFAFRSCLFRFLPVAIWALASDAIWNLLVLAFVTVFFFLLFPFFIVAAAVAALGADAKALPARA